MRAVDAIAVPAGSIALFFRRRSAAIAAALLALLVAAALAAPLLAPQNPYDLAQIDLLDARLPPLARSASGAIHWLGTDGQGRDLLSAILYGLRVSLAVGVSSTSIALAVGLALGLVAAWAGGATDALIGRIADLQLAFPSVLIALALLAAFGPGLGKITAALALVQWAYYARAARAAALVEREKDYIVAAAALGLGPARILWRHLLPNCLPPIVAIAAVQIAAAIALEATLSFLGVGLPVTEPSLGLLVANGFAFLLSGQYWISFYPGLALLALVAALNLVADRLQEILDRR